MSMYVNGQMGQMNWYWDVDLMFHMQITKLIKSLGYMNIKCLWYQRPKYSFPSGLRPLNSDVDVLKFAEDVKGFKVIEVFVEYNIYEPITTDEIPTDPFQFEISKMKLNLKLSKLNLKMPKLNLNQCKLKMNQFKLNQCMLKQNSYQCKLKLNIKEIMKMEWEYM